MVHRLGLLADAIVELEPDIILLQEASASQRHDNVVDLLVAGINARGGDEYNSVFVPAHGSQIIGFFEGEAVLSRFAIEDFEVLRYGVQSLLPPESRIALIVSIDDSVAVKNRFPPQSTQRVATRRAIVSSTKSALKIGTETRDLMKDITFEDCEVYDGERGIVLYARDGGPIEDITWRNIRMFMINWTDEPASGMSFHLTIEDREGPTPVGNNARLRPTGLIHLGEAIGDLARQVECREWIACSNGED